MQATVDRQAAIASKRVAEVEHQRDMAINEAAYNLAFNSDSEAKARARRRPISVGRSSSPSRGASGNEATRKHLAELEMQSNTLEAENLRAELHRAEALSSCASNLAFNSDSEAKARARRRPISVGRSSSPSRGAMQATVDRQAAIASKRVAEVEHQRDMAINEAAYSSC
jgi:hypothetical protein